MMSFSFPPQPLPRLSAGERSMVAYTSTFTISIVSSEASLVYSAPSLGLFSFVVRSNSSFFETRVDNKRLDEWVVEERLDTRKVQWPLRKEDRKDGGGVPTGGNTVTCSRPGSPPMTPCSASSETALTTGSLSAALQRKQAARKRKAKSSSQPGIDNEDSMDSTMSAPPTPAGPRQTGSMVATPSDNIITRMKNVQMIQLGRYRIKPWYFSPYPQVSPSRSKFSNIILFVPL